MATARARSKSLVGGLRQALRLRGWFLARAIRLQIYRKMKPLDRVLEWFRWRKLRRLTIARGRAQSSTADVYLVCPTSYHCGMGHALMEWASAAHLSERYGCKFGGSDLHPDYSAFFGVDAAEVPTLRDLVDVQGYKAVWLPRDRDEGGAELEALLRGAVWKRPGKYVLLYPPGGRPHESAHESFWLLRDLYAAARIADPLPDLITSRESVSVAVHIRRGDLAWEPYGRKRRWRGVEYFVDLARMVEELTDRPVRINVFSQADKKDVNAFDEFEGVQYFLSSDPSMDLNLESGPLDRGSAAVSFHQLCQADVLIASPSFFSLLAGAITEGVVLFPDGIERDLHVRIPVAPNTVTIGDDGAVNRAAIREVLVTAEITTDPP